MVLIRPKRHTQKTGDISEQAAITRLLQCGYIVLQPIGQMHRYDLVIEDAEGKFWQDTMSRPAGSMKISLLLCSQPPVVRITP